MSRGPWLRAARRRVGVQCRGGCGRTIYMHRNQPDALRRRRGRGYCRACWKREREAWPGPGKSAAGSNMRSAIGPGTPRVIRTFRRRAAGPAPSSTAPPRPSALFSDGIRSIAAILEQYDWLVALLINRWDPPAHLRDDLRQQARIGLWKAARRFRPEQGVAFTTYAAPVIRGEMQHWLRDHLTAVRTPRVLWERGHRTVMTSIDAMFDHSIEVGGSARLPRQLTAEEPGFARAEALAELARLPKLKRTSLFLYHFAGWTQSEIAALVGVSQRHVSRMVRAKGAIA